MSNNKLYSKISTSAPENDGDEINGKWIYVFPSEEEFVKSMRRVFDNPEIIDWSNSTEKEYRKILREMIDHFEGTDTELASKSLYFLTRRAIEYNYPILLNMSHNPILGSLNNLSDFIESPAWKKMSKQDRTLLLAGLGKQKMRYQIVLILSYSLF